MDPSEQALPFSEAAIEAAARVVTWMARENEGYVAPYDEWLPQTLAAAVNADPRAKAFLRLAALTDEELVERVASARFPEGDEVFSLWQCVAARAVLAALGLIASPR